MAGNRHLFSPMLHGAIVLLTIIFMVFGILAYLNYGVNTAQSINLSIQPQNGMMSIAVNVTLMIGVVFTFPLQLFPVIEMFESRLIGAGNEYRKVNGSR